MSETRCALATRKVLRSHSIFAFAFANRELGSRPPSAAFAGPEGPRLRAAPMPWLEAVGRVERTLYLLPVPTLTLPDALPEALPEALLPLPEPASCPPSAVSE